METKPLHPVYFNIAFRTNVPVPEWPVRFAIITAYATTGESWSPERTARADEGLHNELLRRGLAPLRIIGYDPDSGRADPVGPRSCYWKKRKSWVSTFCRMPSS